MKTFIATVVAALSVHAHQVRFAPLTQNVGGQVIPNEYIVMLQEPEGLQQHDSYPELVDAHLHEIFGESLVADRKVMQKYNLGYAAVLTEEELLKVQQAAGVDYIEQNSVVRNDFIEGTVTQKSPENWGLKRMSQRELPMKDEYVYSATAGEGVLAYVIDNGVLAEHVEFEDRVVLNKVFVSEKESDGNHGTHVASTIAGKNYGVAKKTRIANVKVLSSAGSGTMASVVGGIEFVAKHHKQRLSEAKTAGKSEKDVRAVANMSLGGGRSSALNSAVANLIKAGVLVVVASGNSNADACRFSPASEASALTVNAADKTDRRAYFSNYGRCSDIFSSGLDITAAWNDNKTSRKTISGTSMASPHVCGLAALLLAEEYMTPQELKEKIIKLSTSNAIKNAGLMTPNRLAFSNPNGDSDLVHSEMERVSEEELKSLSFQQ